MNIPQATNGNVTQSNIMQSPTPKKVEGKMKERYSRQGFLGEAGQLAIAYKVYRCWVSEYQALPDLDANANAVAIQHIKLENEGWERDL